MVMCLFPVQIKKGPVWCLPVWAIENFFLVKQYHMVKERFFIQIENTETSI